MQVIIEDYFKNHSQALLFVDLINTIIAARDEKTLREGMYDLSRRHYTFDNTFVVGFGHNHMWVNEKRSRHRLLIVNF